MKTAEELAQEAGATIVAEDDPQCWSGQIAFDSHALSRFADLVLEEAAKVALDEAVKSKEKYESEQTWEQPYAGNRLLHLGWNIQDTIRAMKGQK